MALDGLDGGDFTLDAGQIAGRELHLAAVLERDPLCRIVLVIDSELHAARFSLCSRLLHFIHPQRVCPWGRVQSQADDADPLTGVGRDQHRLFAEPGAWRSGASRDGPKRNHCHAAGDAGCSGQGGVRERGQQQGKQASQTQGAMLAKRHGVHPATATQR